jgi:hypothetical protein
MRTLIFILLWLLTAGFSFRPREELYLNEPIFDICETKEFQDHFYFNKYQGPFYIYQGRSLGLYRTELEREISNRMVVFTEQDMKTPDQIEVVSYHFIENLYEVVLLHRASNSTVQLVFKKKRNAFKLIKASYGVF